ncbi:PaxU [Apiospora marii]|uniref:PaxU n=1 Tax=Apiospora marii TaxID=335849 RepID=UPI00312F1A3C
MGHATTPSNSPFPGFTRISDQIYIHHNNDNTTTDRVDHDDSHPDKIIIYGWGDGRPKNVSKYIEGYRALFPGATIIVVLATTFKAAYQPLLERTQGMMPVIDAAFSEKHPQQNQPPRVLLHAMSNAGGINLASTLNAHLARHGVPLPHRVMVLDSVPGGVVFHQQVGRWSRAMAIGMRRSLPRWVPQVVLQAVFYVFLWLNKFWEFVLRRHHAGAWSREAVNRHEMVAVPPPAATKKSSTIAGEYHHSRRLYLYSKEDDIIGWEDIEEHAKDASKLGYHADTELFDGSGHVDHMRHHPQKYWASIERTWRKAHAAV